LVCCTFAVLTQFQSLKVCVIAVIVLNVQQLLNLPAFSLLNSFERQVVSELYNVLNSYCTLRYSKISELSIDYAVLSQVWKCQPIPHRFKHLELVEITKMYGRLHEKYFFTDEFAIIRLEVIKHNANQPFSLKKPVTVRLEIFVLSQ